MAADDVAKKGDRHGLDQVFRNIEGSAPET